MNPVDHPHGGGEGRAPIGREKPLTPWGRTAILSSPFHYLLNSKCQRCSQI